MALFGGKETKEDKQQKKMEELLQKYGLTELSDPQDFASVKAIAGNLAGNNLITLGTSLAGKAEEAAKLTYMQALIEQNWIIIRQLDRLNKKSS